MSDQMWTTDNRANYDRDKLRSPSNLTMQSGCSATGQRRVCAELRVQWRYIPKDLPPKSTLHDYLVRWSDDNTLTAIHHALYPQCREIIRREASPTACIIDSQSVKSTERGGRIGDPHGYDAGIKIKGKKRIS